MLTALRPVLTDRPKAQAILQRFWRLRIAFIWTVTDVHRAANERGLVLTPAQAQTLLHRFSERYNPQCGLKWTDLWDLIDESGLGRKLSPAQAGRFRVDNEVIIYQRRRS